MNAEARWMFERYGVERVDEVEPIVRALYAEVYAEAPYNETAESVAAWIAGPWARQRAMAGFAVVVARAREGQPAGMGYGVALPVGSRWWAGLPSPLPLDEAREDGKRTFVIMEFVVRSGFRRDGLGSALHDALVGPWRGERTALTARQDAPGALAFWSAQGYRSLGPSVPRESGPRFETFVRSVD
ncbi:GNAT family N-acetyltransferase [Embleya sp. NBC_00888]|uniref:GNAT family N-acetyltransferase n=1 Tax=Embleya sp. NBC_00888 TaxID=2975960 RepID=UPI00386B4B81